MNEQQFSHLRGLLSQPTAPFREHHVAAYVTEILRGSEIPHFFDPIGNIVIGAASATDYHALVARRSTEPLRLFIAHMDHPGFHGVRWLENGRLRIKWHGGSPTKYLANARVWLATESGRWADGTLTRPSLIRSGRALDTAEIRVMGGTRQSPRPGARRVFGGLRFRAPVWRSGKRLYTHAADDLVGVYAIIETALRHRSALQRHKLPFLGLLTRAEEVGFVGAIGHFELAWLRGPRPVVCVSLEASRTLPGAEIGKGPVLRLGDRGTVFDANRIRVAQAALESSLRGSYQQRIMDGGACEGYAATAYGLPTIGVSVPLGNYHNQGFEGGQDCTRPQGPAPEFVSLDDIDGLLKLCHSLLRKKLPWRDPWQPTRVRLQKNFRRYRAKLG